MGGVKYGYARVSTDDENPALQLAALNKAGCQSVYRDEGAPDEIVQRLCVDKRQLTFYSWNDDRELQTQGPPEPV
jgi:hypothetical protein